MPSATGNVRPLILATDQLCDSFVRAPLGPHVWVRLLSQRCHEADTQALRNQDYALLCSVDCGRSLAFCVCDGVGSSYRGDFAAAYLAVRMVRWLAALPPPEAAGEAAVRGDEAWLHTRLSAELLVWSRAGQEKLRQVAMPLARDALVREVLEELREGYGSEAVFLAGRVDRVGGPDDARERAAPHAGDEAERSREDGPGGAPNRARARAPTHLVFCWMGNITAQVFSAPDDLALLRAPGDDRNRWSTTRRLRGALHVVSAVTPELSRLIVHTDGADSLSASLVAFSDDALQEHARRLREAPGSDDVTILDVRWDPPTREDTTGAGDGARDDVRDMDDDAHGIIDERDEAGRGLDRA